jgi:hypothetical protein
MKIVKNFWKKVFLLSILLVNIFCTGTGTGLYKKGGQSNNKSPSEVNKLLQDYEVKDATNKNLDLPDVPLYWEGWIKYLHYTENDKKEAKAFWKNPEFENQMKRGIQGDINAKDEVH